MHSFYAGRAIQVRTGILFNQDQTMQKVKAYRRLLRATNTNTLIILVRHIG